MRRLPIPLMMVGFAVAAGERRRHRADPALLLAWGKNPAAYSLDVDEEARIKGLSV